ncbi:hypothetical protein AB4068_11260 [Arthrobacter sp. 2RAF22]|uniref:DUF2510 domain-containing protein n=1 Tax=Arthrobacter sp. 2RAF22 TaxID=3232996 RepID=UPI003F9045D3
MNQTPSQSPWPPGPYTDPARNARPVPDKTTPLYNPFIRVILAMPVAGALLGWAMVPVTRYMYAGHIVTASPLSVFTPTYFLLLGASGLLYAATVVLAYFDWRRLGQAGVVRPFHWAWGFLPAVYIIGRTVIIRKALPGRSLAPIVYLIAVLVVSTVFSAIKASSTLLVQ